MMILVHIPASPSIKKKKLGIGTHGSIPQVLWGLETRASGACSYQPRYRFSERPFFKRIRGRMARTACTLSTETLRYLLMNT